MQQKKNNKKFLYQCSFCGKTSKEVGFLIEGNALNQKACICLICHNTCNHIFLFKNKDDKKSISINRKASPLAKITPKKIKSFLDQHIVGQDRAKCAVSISVANHYKRIFKTKSELEKVFPDVKIEKSNVLFVGPTGSGKTLMIKKLADFLDVPLAIGDATCLTEAGYVGEDVESLVSTLYRNSDYDIKRTECGIIYIDEIDKIAKSRNNVSITKDVSGEGVQQSLLKLIEGTICNVSPQGGRKHPEQKFIQIDTSNILFICGGTFFGIDDIVNRRNGQKMGFCNSVEEDRNNSNVTPEDLVRFGMIPEFIGRFPLIEKLEKLEIETLFKILTEPKNSLVNQFKKVFYFDDVDLHFEDDALYKIAEMAYELETGARGLKQVMEKVLFNFNFNVDEYKNKKLVITVDDVNNNWKSVANF